MNYQLETNGRQDFWFNNEKKAYFLKKNHKNDYSLTELDDDIHKVLVSKSGNFGLILQREEIRVFNIKRGKITQRVRSKAELDEAIFIRYMINKRLFQIDLMGMMGSLHP